MKRTINLFVDAAAVETLKSLNVNISAEVNAFLLARVGRLLCPLEPEPELTEEQQDFQRVKAASEKAYSAFTEKLDEAAREESQAKSAELYRKYNEALDAGNKEEADRIREEITGRPVDAPLDPSLMNIKRKV